VCSRLTSGVDVFECATCLTESLQVTITNDRCSSSLRPAAAANAAAYGQRSVTTCRTEATARDQSLRSEGSPLTLTRTQRRRQQRRRTDRQVAGVTDRSRARGRLAPGVYSLPIRVDRDALATPTAIGIRVLDGFVNIFEVPSASYHQATEQSTRVREYRPAGLSDESETEDVLIERSLWPQNYCMMCGQGMEDYCMGCNILRSQFPDLS